MNLNQNDLADRVNCSLSTIKRIEQGEICNPQLLGSICGVVNVTCDELSALLKSRRYIIPYKNKDEQEEEEIENLIATARLKQMKRRKFIISILATAVATFALLANSEAIAAKLKQVWELITINTEKNYAIFRGNVDENNNPFHEESEEDHPIWYYSIPIYLPTGEQVSRSVADENQKTILQYQTEQGQGYQFLIQDVDRIKKKEIQHYFEECQERKILLDTQKVTLFYTEQKVAFILGDLFYLFDSYEFDTEQMIDIIQNMEQKFLRKQMEQIEEEYDITIRFKDFEKSSEFPKDIRTTPIYQPSENKRLQMDYAEESGMASLTFLTEQEQEYKLDIQVAKKTAEEYANLSLHDYKKGAITGNGLQEVFYYSTDEKMVLFILDNLLYVFYDYDFDISQIFQTIVTMKKQTLN